MSKDKIQFYIYFSSVPTICLRNNQLDNEAVKLIAFGIGDFNKQNPKLLHLHLCSNQIGDEGAVYLANVIVVFKHILFIYSCLYTLTCFLRLQLWRHVLKQKPPSVSI